MTYLSILYVIEFIAFLYLGINTLYLLTFAIAGLFNLKRKKINPAYKRKTVVLIPGYREDDVIIDVAKEALKQDYGKEFYDVAIIADGFKKETIETLKSLEIKLFEVQLKFSTKSRALNAALDKLDDTYEIAVVLDADNIMEPDFLTKINQAFCQGYLAVQGHRVAKNMNTPFAVLDAVSEEMNNHIFRKGHRVIRLSSALIGSAMAFEFHHFKKMMKEVEVVGGFDKELELRLLSQKRKIEYLPDAYVFDEKVANAKVFTKQRRRWLSAQFHFFGKSFIPALKSLFKNGNIDYFNKAMQFILIPRIMLISLLFIISLFLGIFNIHPYFEYWLYLFIGGFLTFVFSIPTYFYNLKTLRAITWLPLGIFLIFLSLFRLKGSNKEFLHTKHTYNAFQIKHSRFKSKK